MSDWRWWMVALLGGLVLWIVLAVLYVLGRFTLEMFGVGAHSFVYDADAFERLSRAARSLGWRVRFVGISVAECGVFFVHRRSGVAAPVKAIPTPDDDEVA